MSWETNTNSLIIGVIRISKGGEREDRRNNGKKKFLI